MFVSQGLVRKTEITLSVSNRGHLLQIINNIGDTRAKKPNREKGKPSN